jgi:hypothetical protein
VSFDCRLSLTVSSCEINFLLVFKQKVRAFQTTLSARGAISSEHQSSLSSIVPSPICSSFSNLTSSSSTCVPHSPLASLPLLALPRPSPRLRTTTHTALTRRASLLLTGVCAHARLPSRELANQLVDYWCQQNEAQCPLICLQQPGVTSSTTDDNSCDPVSSTTPTAYVGEV